MKRKASIGFVCLGILLSLCLSCRAQDKPKPEEQKKVVTTVKVQVTLTEYEGEKKVAVLPYSFLVNSEDGHSYTNYSNFLRVGVRVPVIGIEKDVKAQYIDIGSNIDCGVTTEDDGRFSVRLTLERSSLYSARKDDDKNTITTADAGQPIVPTFRTQSLVVLRDGQATEIIAAVDPLNGHLFRVNVTLNVQR